MSGKIAVGWSGQQDLLHGQDETHVRNPDRDLKNFLRIIKLLEAKKQLIQRAESRLFLTWLGLGGLGAVTMIFSRVGGVTLIFILIAYLYSPIGLLGRVNKYKSDIAALKKEALDLWLYVQSHFEIELYSMNNRTRSDVECVRRNTLMSVGVLENISDKGVFAIGDLGGKARESGFGIIIRRQRQPVDSSGF